MTPYYIFMDIDRTLIGPDRKADPATVAAIKHYQALGHQFFIATGRLLKSAHHVANTLGLDLNFIASNGAVTDYNHQVTTTLMGPAALKSLYQIITDDPIATHFFTPDHVLNLNDDAHVGEDGKNRIGGLSAANYVHINSEAELLAWQNQIVNGICIDRDDADHLNRVRRQLDQLPTITTSSSFPTNIELTPAGVSKASAITAFCAAHQVPLDRTIAFGDGMNDLAMLTTVAHGVAMANAVPEVAAATKYHTTAYDDNGIGRWLDQFLGGN